MGLFWKRKSGDQFVSLRLNEPLPEKTPEEASSASESAAGAVATRSSTTAGEESKLPAVVPEAPVLEPVSTGAGPTPVAVEPRPTKPFSGESRAEPPRKQTESPRPPVTQQQPVAAPPRSPFMTSVLGLNLSIEELQAQEA